PVSAEEQAAGLAGHGEAHEAPFEVKFYGKEGTKTTLTLSTRLPITQEMFARSVRMVDGENVVYVESELESLLGFDRPIFWAEHATIGSPFLEPGKTVIDMSARRGNTRSHASGASSPPHRLAYVLHFPWRQAPAAAARPGPPPR